MPFRLHMLLLIAIVMLDKLHSHSLVVATLLTV